MNTVGDAENVYFFILLLSASSNINTLRFTQHNKCLSLGSISVMASGTL